MEDHVGDNFAWVGKIDESSGTITIIHDFHDFFDK